MSYFEMDRRALTEATQQFMGRQSVDRWQHLSPVFSDHVPVADLQSKEDRKREKELSNRCMLMMGVGGGCRCFKDFDFCKIRLAVWLVVVKATNHKS